MDSLVAAVLFLGAQYFLLQRNLGYLGVWLLLVTVVLVYGTRMKYTPSVLMAIGTVVAVIYLSGQSLRERFEDKEEKEEEKEEEPEAHMDMGSTLIQAYKKLKPVQVQQMQADTKELMATQRELMETLSTLAPQVQQGAELVKSFQGMFGGNIAEVLKK
jgi:hypothetical protein